MPRRTGNSGTGTPPERTSTQRFRVVVDGKVIADDLYGMGALRSFCRKLKVSYVAEAAKGEEWIVIRI